jgi:hypothetical protein
VDLTKLVCDEIVKKYFFDKNIFCKNRRRCSILVYFYFRGRHDPPKKLEHRVTPKYIFKQVVVVVIMATINAFWGSTVCIQTYQ